MLGLLTLLTVTPPASAADGDRVIRVGTEGTAESQKITTNRAITSRAKDSELDQVHAIAMAGDLTPGQRLRTAVKRDNDDEILRIIDELNDDERKQVLRDGPVLSQLQSQLSQFNYERAFKVLTGQGDLADRLYSRSHGGSWSERKITGGTDETGMREDIKRYIRALRIERLMSPMAAGVLSAFGFLVAPPSVRLVRSYVVGAHTLDWNELDRLVAVAGHARRLQPPGDPLQRPVHHPGCGVQVRQEPARRRDHDGGLQSRGETPGVQG